MNILQSQTGRIGISAVVMAMIVGSWAGGVPTAVAADAPPPCGQGPTSPVINQFVDEAVQPPVAAPDRPNHYTLTAHLGSHSFQSGKPAVPTLGYSTANAQMDYLGPTIITKEGTPVDVKIVNNLPSAGTRLFPFDPPNDNSVVLHRHGGIQAAASDGTPDQKIAPGDVRTNHYPNSQAAGPLWYHDHNDMTTSYNVYEGLAGFMPNTDNIEPLFQLPAGDFSKAYVLQDKSFDLTTYALCYSHESPEFFGDTPVVNGTVAPKQTVEPRRYTFTFINGSDSRFFHLTLQRAMGTAGTRPQMTVVGNDSGYLYRPAEVNDLLIAPGERYMVVVDFTGHSGSWVLSNDARAPFPAGDRTIASIPQIMRFDVGETPTGVDRSVILPVLAETNNNIASVELSLQQARLRTLQAAEPALMPGMPMLGTSDSLLRFRDKVTETPQLGSTEAWALRNHSPDAHPIHEHLVELQLVGRWPVTKWSEQDATGSAVPVKVGKFQPAGTFESGPKDTFVAPPDMITVWVGKYTIGGVSVWHCHILSHEDNAMAPMMRPLAVGTAEQTQLPMAGTLATLDALVRPPYQP